MSNDFLELKVYDLPKSIDGYGDVEIYFTNTNDFTLIVIPTWNFSFKWELENDSVITKSNLQKALSKPMADSDAEVLADKVLNYLYTSRF